MKKRKRWCGPHEDVRASKISAASYAGRNGYEIFMGNDRESIWSGSAGWNIFISKCIAVECYNIYSFNILLHVNWKNCIY